MREGLWDGGSVRRQVYVTGFITRPEARERGSYSYRTAVAKRFQDKGVGP
jgi:hypothetical protein